MAQLRKCLENDKTFSLTPQNIQYQCASKAKEQFMNVSSCRNSSYCQVRHISTVSFQLNKEFNTDLHQTIIQGDNQSCHCFAWHKNTEVPIRIAGRIQYLFLKKGCKSKISVSLKEWQDQQNPNNKTDLLNVVPPPHSVQTQSERFLTTTSKTLNPGTVAQIV